MLVALRAFHFVFFLREAVSAQLAMLTRKDHDVGSMRAALDTHVILNNNFAVGSFGQLSNFGWITRLSLFLILLHKSVLVSLQSQ